MLVAQLAQARDHASWHAWMAPALAPLNGQGLPSTSEAAPGLLAYGAHALEAHHAPDLFPGQHKLVTAVSGPMATKERAAHTAVTEAREQRERLQSAPQSTGEAPDKRGPGRPPQAPVRLEHAEHALKAARRAHERLTPHRAQVQARLRGLGHDDHGVDRERGVRRNGHRMASDIHGHLEQRRTMAQHAGRSQHGMARLEQAERVVPNMQATLACVSGSVRQQGAQLDGTPPVSFVMPAKRIPAYDLDRVAQTRSVSAGEPLRELAERLRASWCAPGGVCSALRPEAQDHLHDEAKRLAAVFQRSSAHGEGRNGSLALRSHQLRGRDRPRKRACGTALHHFFLTRPDGTTAAERFFGQKPRSMFAAIVDSVELAPAPLSPPRKA
jgi:hypothetical protein